MHARWVADVLGEGSGERCRRFEPDAKPHLRYALVGLKEQRFGPLEPPLGEVPMWRLMVVVPKQSGEVKARKASLSRQPIEVERVTVLGVDKVSCSLQLLDNAVLLPVPIAGGM